MGNSRSESAHFHSKSLDQGSQTCSFFKNLKIFTKPFKALPTYLLWNTNKPKQFEQSSYNGGSHIKGDQYSRSQSRHEGTNKRDHQEGNRIPCITLLLFNLLNYKSFTYEIEIHTYIHTIT